MDNNTLPLSLIIAKSALVLLKKHAPGVLEEIATLERESMANHFPDGSVCIENAAAVERYRMRYEPHCLGNIIWGHTYHALAPFSKYWYALDYPKSYYEETMPSGFIVGKGIAIFDRKPSEFKLDDLTVTVGFLRRPRREAMEQFAAMVYDWGESVRAHGMFGEGPIALVSKEIEFNDRRAQFQVDAQRSGQNTLNWFFLKGLDFGLEVFPIDLIKLDEEEFVATWFGRHPAGTMTTLPIQSYARSPKLAAVRASVNYPLPESLPADCVPFKKIKSKLRLFKRPSFDLEAMQITTYFTAAPAPNVKEAFNQLIKSWDVVGSHGGFGGQGLRIVGDVRFDDETRSASFYSNLGDADKALPALVRILEAFNETGLPIEAVVFGRGLSDQVVI